MQDVTVSVQSPSAVMVSWLPPHPQTWNGLIVNYTVVYTLIGPLNTNDSSADVGVTLFVIFPSAGMIPVNSLDPRVASLPIRHESVIVEDLHEYHVYEFEVYMANSAGRSELSSPILQELPGAGKTQLLVISKHLHNLSIPFLNQSHLELPLPFRYRYCPPHLSRSCGCHQTFWNKMERLKCTKYS